jgi:hypothetical protein
MLAALGFLSLEGRPEQMPPALLALHRCWLDSWVGIGAVEHRTYRQEYDLALTRYAYEGWRATFYNSGKELRAGEGRLAVHDPALGGRALEQGVQVCISGPRGDLRLIDGLLERGQELAAEDPGEDPASEDGNGTSDTDPLIIGWVSDSCVRGSVGLTLCPGKKQRDGVFAHWDRDLAKDLGAIHDSDATSLVSLVEDDWSRS